MATVTLRNYRGETVIREESHTFESAAYAVNFARNWCRDSRNGPDRHAEVVMSSAIHLYDWRGIVAILRNA